MSNTFETGEKLKHFVIKKLLGEGGMGEVYLAYDESLSRDVAIKTLKLAKGELHDSLDAVRRFLSEAKVLAQLKSYAITTIYYISKEEENVPYIIMEFLEGQSLKEYSKAQHLNIQFIVDCLIEVSEGLQEAHKKGIIHRDIKPANLFFTKDQKFKILDFGIAKWEGAATVELTEANHFVGSLLYAAPECFNNTYDHRIDIYSLGISMIELIAGRIPFESSTTYKLLHQIQHKDIRFNDRISEILPNDLTSLLYEMVEKDPGDRPQSILEVSKRAKKIKKSYQKILGRSISNLLENGEIEIDIDDTFILRDLVVSQESKKSKAAKFKKTSKAVILPNKKSMQISFNLVTSVFIVISLAVGGFFFYNFEISISSLVENTEYKKNKQEVDNSMLYNSYRLIEDLPASAQKKRLQKNLSELEKLANAVIEKKKKDPNLSWHLMQLNRKIMKIEKSLKENSLIEAEAEIIILKGILVRRGKGHRSQRRPAKAGTGEK